MNFLLILILTILSTNSYAKIREIHKDNQFVREYIPVDNTDFKYKDEHVEMIISPRTAESAIPLIFQNNSKK